MKKLSFVISAAFCLIIFSPVVLAQATYTIVTTNTFTFDPDSITVAVGDTVKW